MNIGEPFSPASGTCVNDVAARLAEVWERKFRHQEGGPHVASDRSVEIFDPVDVGFGVGGEDAGIADQDVDPAKSSERKVHQGTHAHITWIKELPQPIQRTSGLLRVTGVGTGFACPTMIGATGTQALGMPSKAFPSDVARKLCAKPIQQVPSAAAYALSIKFSAANAQSSTIQEPSAIAEIRISTGA